MRGIAQEEKSVKIKYCGGHRKNQTPRPKAPEHLENEKSLAKKHRKSENRGIVVPKK